MSDASDPIDAYYRKDTVGRFPEGCTTACPMRGALHSHRWPDPPDPPPPAEEGLWPRGCHAACPMGGTPHTHARPSPILSWDDEMFIRALRNARARGWKIRLILEASRAGGSHGAGGRGQSDARSWSSEQLTQSTLSPPVQMGDWLNRLPS